MTTDPILVQQGLALAEAGSAPHRRSFLKRASTGLAALGALMVGGRETAARRGQRALQGLRSQRRVACLRAHTTSIETPQ